jgi:hypothetical protein
LAGKTTLMPLLVFFHQQHLRKHLRERTINLTKRLIYQYDAGGRKLKKTTSDGLMTDYVGNLIFENNTLYQISHDEGRIVNDIYEYNISDNLGNLRIAFKDSAGIAKITQAPSLAGRTTPSRGTVSSRARATQVFDYQ